MSKWFRINEITDWEEDSSMIAGDASHEGDRAVQRLLEAERVKKIDNNEWRGLPFICEADNEIEALEKYTAKFYEFEYIKPVEADCEEVHKFEVSRQIDCRDYVTVFATDFKEASEKADYIDIEPEKLEFIETHIVDATDKVTGEFKELC